jgi:hypothetical protein
MRDARAVSGIQRLLGVGLSLIGVVVVLRYTRADARRDPVGAIGAVARRYPALRRDIPLDRLGPACDEGDGEACTELGVAFGDVRNSLGELGLPACIEHALFARACDGGHWRGCELLARRGRECGAPDLERARAVLARACEGLVFAACDALAELRASR